MKNSTIMITYIWLLHEDVRVWLIASRLRLVFKTSLYLADTRFVETRTTTSDLPFVDNRLTVNDLTPSMTAEFWIMKTNYHKALENFLLIFRGALTTPCKKAAHQTNMRLTKFVSTHGRTSCPCFTPGHFLFEAFWALHLLCVNLDHTLVCINCQSPRTSSSPLAVAPKKLSFLREIKCFGVKGTGYWNVHVGNYGVKQLLMAPWFR